MIPRNFEYPLEGCLLLDLSPPHHLVCFLINEIQLLWLLLDPNVKDRTQTAFSNLAFEPSPFWFWYWYGYRHYHPKPTYEPNIKTPSQGAKPPTIPGADFADNIATAVENTSNNIVTNLEKFANSILPMTPPKSSISRVL